MKRSRVLLLAASLGACFGIGGGCLSDILFVVAPLLT